MSEKIRNGVLCVVLSLLFLRACGSVVTVHEHDWQAATCTHPRICSACSAEDGEPLGHTWVAATCTEAEHCSVCGKQRHWYSSGLGHDWVYATCTAPKTCARCGETEGEAKGHDTLACGGETVIEATCQEGGVDARPCRYCGEIVEVPTSRALCTPGDWTIIQEATPDTPGIKVKICSMCGKETDRREYTYSAAASTGTSSNGNNFNTYNNEAQQETSAQYVLNTSSRKFHYPSCRDVPKISPANYSTTNRSRSDLIASGWSPCGHCSP